MSIYTNDSDHKFLEAENSKGQLGQYRLSDEVTYRDKPQLNVNYPFGFIPGYYREVLPGTFEPYATSPDFVVEPKDYKLQDDLNTRLSLNTQVNIPKDVSIGKLNLNEIASEDSDIQQQQSKFETHNILQKATDEDINRNWGARAWGTKVGLPILGGAAAATGVAYALPALWGIAGTEILGGLNLYGGYEGAKNLFSEDGLRKTWRKFNSGDYEGSFWSGLGDVTNLATIAFPFTTVPKSYYNVAKEIVYNPKRVYNAVNTNRFRPFMTFSDRRRYLTDLQNRINNDVIPFSENLESQLATNRFRNELLNLEEEQGEGFLENILGISDVNSVRKIASVNDNPVRFTFGKRGVSKSGNTYEGFYTSFDPLSKTGHHIHLANRNSNPFYLYNQDYVSNVAAHELGHYWQNRFSEIDRFRKPVNSYYGYNAEKDTDKIFSPLSKYVNGEWKGNPAEIQSELHKLAYNYKSNNLLETHPEETFNFIAKRFGLSYDEAKEMVINIINKSFYKKGGKLK